MWASHDHAQATCDRCDERWKRSELTEQIINQKKTNLLVCPRCLDIDHPQLMVGRPMKPVRIAIKDPRTDNMILSRFAWPVIPFQTYSTVQGVQP